MGLSPTMDLMHPARHPATAARGAAARAQGGVRVRAAARAVLRGPLARRSWAEAAYLTVGVPLTMAGFLLILMTAVFGAMLCASLAGVAAGLALLTATTVAGRGLAAVHAAGWRRPCPAGRRRCPGRPVRARPRPARPGGRPAARRARLARRLLRAAPPAAGAGQPVRGGQLLGRWPVLPDLPGLVGNRPGGHRPAARAARDQQPAARGRGADSLLVRCAGDPGARCGAAARRPVGGAGGGAGRPLADPTRLLHRRGRCPSGSASCRPAGPRRSTTRPPCSAGSSGTCTTAPRPGWSRWPCSSAWPRRSWPGRPDGDAAAAPTRTGSTGSGSCRRRPPRRQGGPHRAARPGPRYPPARARPRPRRGAGHAGRPQRGPRHADRRTAGPADAGDRDHRLLLRRRAAGQRGQAQRRGPGRDRRHRGRDALRRRSPTTGGGAVLRPGGGLAGLAQRVAVVDGALAVSSPAGGPTVVTVDLPLHA